MNDQTGSQVSDTYLEDGRDKDLCIINTSFSAINPMKDEPYLSLVCSFLTSLQLLSCVSMLDKWTHDYFREFNRKPLVNQLLRQEFGKSYKNPKNIAYIGFNSECNENNWNSYKLITHMYNQELYPENGDDESDNLINICVSIFKSNGLIAFKYYIKHKLSEKDVGTMMNKIWKICAFKKKVSDMLESVNEKQTKVSKSSDQQECLRIISELMQLFDEKSDSCDEHLCLLLKILASSEYKDKADTKYSWRNAYDLASGCKLFVEKRFEDERNGMGMEMLEKKVCGFLEEKNIYKHFFAYVERGFQREAKRLRGNTYEEYLQLIEDFFQE